MPGIDYRCLRAKVPSRKVLELIGFEPSSRRGQGRRIKMTPKTIERIGFTTIRHLRKRSGIGRLIA
jgi:hypothetical protein